MDNFSAHLLLAKQGDPVAIGKLVELYKPLLTKAAIVNKQFDEDLYQELVITLMACIHSF